MEKFLEQIEESIKGISEDFANGRVENYFFVTGNYLETDALKERYGVTAYTDLMAKFGEVTLCVKINVKEK